jgi:PqqD family protein of HPr-rel-A system
MSGCYRAAPALRICDFDDETVVFNPLSWETHVLNPAAAAVLELLQEAPRSLDDVEAFLAEALDPDEACAAHDHAQRVLEELSELRLIGAERNDAAG